MSSSSGLASATIMGYFLRLLQLFSTCLAFSLVLLALVSDRDNVLFIKIEESLTSIFSFWHASKKGNLIFYDAGRE